MSCEKGLNLHCSQTLCIPSYCTDVGLQWRQANSRSWKMLTEGQTNADKRFEWKKQKIPESVWTRPRRGAAGSCSAATGLPEEGNGQPHPPIVKDAGIQLEDQSSQQ